MNDSLYEEYMRSVLGYNMPDYRNLHYKNNIDCYNYPIMQNIHTDEIENYYPDIYRLVYPMIQKACAQNNRPITRELVDDITDEIYFAIEDNEITEETRNKEKTSNNNLENRQRVVRNRTLNDLIRILILRELIGKTLHQRPPMRPTIVPRVENQFYRDYSIFEN